jgi:hypothetical protein
VTRSRRAWPAPFLCPAAAGAVPDPQLPGGGGGRWLPDAPPQPLYTTEQIAHHDGFSIRWVELQLAKGMPSRLIGGHRRFDLGTVDRWLRATYGGR